MYSTMLQAKSDDNIDESNWIIYLRFTSSDLSSLRILRSEIISVFYSILVHVNADKYRLV